MLHFYDRHSMAEALTLNLDPRLHQLLADRINGLSEDLIDHTEYLVVEAGDTEEDIVRVIGFSPLVEPIDGAALVSRASTLTGIGYSGITAGSR